MPGGGGGGGRAMITRLSCATLRSNTLRFFLLAKLRYDTLRSNALRYVTLRYIAKLSYAMFRYLSRRIGI